MRRVFQDHAVQFHAVRVFSPGGASCPPQRPVPRNGGQPPSKPLRFLQLRERLKRQQQSVLRHVFRRVAHNPSRYSDDCGPVSPYQLVERLHLSQGCRNREFRIGILGPGGWLHLAPRAFAARLPPSPVLRHRLHSRIVKAAENLPGEVSSASARRNRKQVQDEDTGDATAECKNCL